MKRAELRNVNKTFETVLDATGRTKTVTALEDVSLAFLPGEIHAILGENGAGKSTLVHILSGLNRPTGGIVLLDGHEVRFDSPSQALAHGIAMVHQRPLLAEDATALDNVLLGLPGIALRRGRRAREITALAKRWSIEVDLAARVRSLDARDRLMTALLSALYREPDFLILDEPTAVLSPDERERFFAALKTASADGRGVILITHRIDEALRLADRVSILRKGHLAFSSPTKKTENGVPVTESLIREFLDPHSDIPGAEIPSTVTRSATHWSDDFAFGFSDLCVNRPERAPLRGLSLNVRKGSITGIFGLPDSGLDTLEDALSGMIAVGRGTIEIAGAKPAEPENHDDANIAPNGRIRLSGKHITPAALRAAGVAFVPSDRSFRGSHPDLTINDLLVAYRDTGFLTNKKADSAFVRSLLDAEELDIPPTRAARTLSGGQLQRLILARELASQPRTLILAEPEHGLDIRSTERLRDTLSRAAASGTAIVILTGDPESIGAESFYHEKKILREGAFA
jgi:simple sugar transport system ATP-binding protein